MATNKPERKVVSLANIQGKVSKRGRKSTVTPADIEDAQALTVGEGFIIEEFSLSGPEFAKYRTERIGRYNGDEAALVNAWQSRYRQRVTALSKASGVPLTAMFTDDGELVAGRTG